MKQTKKGQNALFGTSIWRQLTHIVELKENIRARDDPDYATCLLRMHEGNGTLHSKDGTSDYDVLQSCVLENLQHDNPMEYTSLRDTAVVFSQQHLHDCYNKLKAKEYAQCTGWQLHYYLAMDKIKKKHLQGKERLCVCVKTGSTLELSPERPEISVRWDLASATRRGVLHPCQVFVPDFGTQR